MYNVDALYIHFPFCRHLCNYCDFYKNVPKSKEDEYSQFESSFLQSYEKLKSYLKSNGYEVRPLESLYIGGGTPSLWGERGAKFLSDFLENNEVSLSDSCEFTLEVNPGSWDDESLDAWKSIGVNRFSLGTQSMNSTFIKLLDRIHNIDDVYKTLEKFSQMKANFSVDLMLGLPFSKKYNRDIISELKELLKYDPSHLSLYILTVKEGYIHYNDLPDESWVEKEYLDVANYLASAGMDHYEVSNFSKEGKESIHNLKYWKGESVMALGASATGYLSEVQKRFKWIVNKIDFREEVLSDSDKKLEDLYMRFRTNLGVDLFEFISIEDNNNLEKLINSWRDRDLVVINSKSSVYPTSKGFLNLDSLMNELFVQCKSF